MNLKKFLNSLQRQYHDPHLLDSDPLEFVHRYSDPWDQEAVALLAAVLAYGNVKQIRKSVEDALHRMSLNSTSPKGFVSGLARQQNRKTALKNLQPFIHRFNQGTDLFHLFLLLEKSWSQYGSLGSHLVHYLKPEDPDFGQALSQLMADWQKWLRSGRPRDLLLPPDVSIGWELL